MSPSLWTPLCAHCNPVLPMTTDTQHSSSLWSAWPEINPDNLSALLPVSWSPVTRHPDLIRNGSSSRYWNWILMILWRMEQSDCYLDVSIISLLSGISWSDLMTPPHAETGPGPWSGVTIYCLQSAQMLLIASDGWVSWTNDTVLPRALSSVSPTFLRSLGWRLDSIASLRQALGALALHNVSQRSDDPRNWTPSYNGQMDIGDWTSGQTRDIRKSVQHLECDMCTLVSGLVKTLIVVRLSVYSWHPLLPPPHPPQVSPDHDCHNGVIVITDVTWQLWPIWGRGGNHEYKQSARMTLLSLVTMASVCPGLSYRNVIFHCEDNVITALPMMTGPRSRRW